MTRLSCSLLCFLAVSAADAAMAAEAKSVSYLQVQRVVEDYNKQGGKISELNLESNLVFSAIADMVSNADDASTETSIVCLEADENSTVDYFAIIKRESKTPRAIVAWSKIIAPSSQRFEEAVKLKSEPNFVVLAMSEGKIVGKAQSSSLRSSEAKGKFGLAGKRCIYRWDISSSNPRRVFTIRPSAVKAGK